MEGSTSQPQARPVVHFTPPYGWMNDPNGLVYVDGTYHLCYQHHPDDLLWGPMHWGHATSRDLLVWEHRPVALLPDRLGAAFSGSALVDHDGVAGFGAGAVVAFYTHYVEDAPQSQGIAYSTDGGTTWQGYAGNPVVLAPEGRIDFRDPKVFRLDLPGEPGWSMVVVAGREVLFYRSTDLLHWRPAGSFGDGAGFPGGVWETPDLFELPVGDSGERRWVLTVSLLGGGPAGGTGTQYFVGDFDGSAFVPASPARWVDHGADFYAPQSWSDTPAGRRVWLGWMSNWDYARETPASEWRGAMTVPRDLALVRRDADVELVQHPVRELDEYAVDVGSWDAMVLEPGKSVVVASGAGPYDVVLTMAAATSGLVPGETAGTGVLEVRRGDAAPTRVACDLATGSLSVEPSPAELPEGCRAARQVAPVVGVSTAVSIRVLVDATSVEVFADEGRAVFTNQVFGDPELTEVVLLAEYGAVRLEHARARRLAP